MQREKRKSQMKTAGMKKLISIVDKLMNTNRNLIIVGDMN